MARFGREVRATRRARREDGRYGWFQPRKNAKTICRSVCFEAHEEEKAGDKQRLLKCRLLLEFWAGGDGAHAVLVLMPYLCTYGTTVLPYVINKIYQNSRSNGAADYGRHSSYHGCRGQESLKCVKVLRLKNICDFFFLLFSANKLHLCVGVIYEVELKYI